MSFTGNPASLPGPVVVVAGPTAVGKSELSLDLADALNGEIVNADSMQLYRGMDIGTAKLPVDLRRGIPHHLLDIWDVTHTADVASYQELARWRVDQILQAGKIPLLVGGSGLYVQAVIEKMEFPGTEPALRAELESELEAVGPHALHERLAAADPQAAREILPSNGRRIVRALEVVALTGSFRAHLPRERRPVYRTAYLALDRDTAALDERVARRAELMWSQGLVDEVRELVGQGLRRGRTASRALGYRQVLRFLDGECSQAEAREHTIAATRRFIRRQRSWFRRAPRVHWLDASAAGLRDEAMRIIAAAD